MLFFLVQFSRKTSLSSFVSMKVGTFLSQIRNFLLPIMTPNILLLLKSSDRNKLSGLVFPLRVAGISC